MSAPSSLVAAVLDWSLESDSAVVTGSAQAAWPTSNLTEAQIFGPRDLWLSADRKTTSMVVQTDLGPNFLERPVRAVALARHNAQLGYWRQVAGHTPNVNAQRSMLPNGETGSPPQAGSWPDVAEPVDTANDLTFVELAGGTTYTLTMATPAGALPVGIDRSVVRVRAKRQAGTGGTIEVKAKAGTVELTGSPRSQQAYLVSGDWDEYIVAFDAGELADPSALRVSITYAGGGTGTLRASAVEWQHDLSDPAFVTPWEPITGTLIGPGGVDASQLPAISGLTSVKVLASTESLYRHWETQVRLFGVSATRVPSTQSTPSYLQAARHVVSPALVAQVLEDQSVTFAAVGGEVARTPRGVPWRSAPSRNLRRYPVVLEGTAAYILGEVLQGTVSTGLLDTPFALALLPEEHPDHQTALGWIATRDIERDMEMTITAASRVDGDNRVRVSFTAVEV